jgi:hypothetical protein
MAIPQSIDALSTPMLLPVLPTVATPVVHIASELVPSNHPLPATKPLPTLVDQVDNSIGLKPEWDVVYNPVIRRALEIHVAETFTYNQSVKRVKFSRDGKYLAVALVNGETHIHDLETFSKR